MPFVSLLLASLLLFFWGEFSFSMGQVLTPQNTDATVFAMQLSPGGMLSITVGGETFLVDSFFSEPRVPKGGWNMFGEAPNSDAWSVSVDRSDPKALRVIGKGRYYQIEREYSQKANHIEVADRVTITHDAAIAIHIRNRLQLGRHDIEELRLGGRDVFQGRGLCGSANLGNPTLFVKSKSAGIAMLPLDDVFLAHAEVYNRAVAGLVFCSVSDPPAAELTDPHLGLDGGKTYTLRWAIYPVPRQWNYFTFINAVRRSLDANFPIDGSAIFFYPTSASLNRAGYPGDWRQWDRADMANFLRDQGIRYVIAGGAPRKAQNQFAHGSAFLYELGSDSEAFHRDLIKKVHEANNAVKVLVYFNSLISTETGADTKYHEDRIVDGTGNQVGYPSDPSHLPLFYGTETNKYGRELEKYVEKALTDFGADGIYIDEFSQLAARYNYDGKWDGFSVEIDPTTFQLRRKIASVELITLPERMAIIHKVRQLGRVVVANEPPITETAAREKVVHFNETDTLTNLYAMHLHSPVGLNKPSERGGNAPKDVVAQLDYGALSYLYDSPYPKNASPNPMSRMFPVTPIEINKGYIIGKERIITTSSGTFGWNAAGALQVFIYDAHGQEKSHSVVPSGNPTSATVRLDPGELAIIVKEEFAQRQAGSDSQTR